MTNFSTVRALQRGLIVLESLNKCIGARPQQIAKMTGLPRPTVYRLLETMERLGYLAKSATDDRWYLTQQVRALSAGFYNDAWISRVASPVIAKLGKEILWPMDLVTLAGGRMVILDTTHPTSPFSIDRGLVSVPILATSGGRAYISFCPDAERKAIIDNLARSDAEEHRQARDKKYIKRLVETTRAAGYGSRTEGFNSHTASFSLPIRWDRGVIACLTLIWIRSALPYEEALARYLGPVREAVHRIEGALVSDEAVISQNRASPAQPHQPTA